MDEMVRTEEERAPLSARRTPAWKMWLDVFIHPGVDIFEAYLDELSPRRAAFWLVSLSALIAFFSSLSLYLSFRYQRDFLPLLPPEIRRWLEPFLHPYGLQGLVTVIGGVVALTFLIVIGICLTQLITIVLSHVAAKLMDGEATFGGTFSVIILAEVIGWLFTGLLGIATLILRTSMLGALISLPLNALSLILSLYTIILEGFGIAAAHRISTIRGFIAALVPVILSFILSCLFSSVLTVIFIMLLSQVQM